MHAKDFGIKTTAKTSPKLNQNLLYIYLNSLPTKKKVKKRFWRFVMGARKKHFSRTTFQK
jgi:hypothetical protein